MGGCRCTFRDCQNNTANTQKRVHFFHYPHKDSDRVIKWCQFANTESFLTLSSEKLRNKVVCELHFRFDEFMNLRKERLIKTAVPTLLYTKFGGIVDLEVYNLSQLNYETTPEELDQLGVEIDKELTQQACVSDAPELVVVAGPSTVVLHNSILSKNNKESKSTEISFDLAILNLFAMKFFFFKLKTTKKIN